MSPVKKSPWLIILWWFLLPLAAYGQAKGHGVEVRAAIQHNSVAAPGSTVSGSFLVINVGTSDLTLEDELQLPPGWIQIFPQNLPFPLDFRDLQVRTVAFIIPALEKAGSYQVRYAAREQSESGISDSKSVTVTVTPPSGAPEDGARDVVQPAEDERGHGVEVKSTKGGISEVAPGSVVSGSSLVINTGSNTETFIDELRLPPTWKKLIPPAAIPFNLTAGAQQARLIAFSVPLNAPAGSYRISHAVRGSQNAALFGDRNFTVRILPVHKIDIIVEDKPEFVIAGQPINIQIRVVNRGNSLSRIKTDLRGNLDYPVAPKGTVQTLVAGQSALLNVTVATDDLIKKKEAYVLNIKAVTENQSGSGTTAAQACVIYILPATAEKADLYQRMPARLTTIGSVEDGKYGWQVELAGAGTLDEEGKKRIDFLFRGPDLQRKNIFGLREEYRLDYFADKFSILAGDHAFSLSPLTEQSRYGRGGGMNLRQQKIGVGAFYLETLDCSPQQDEAGGYLSYQVAERLGIKGNILHKTSEIASVPEINSNLYSIQATSEWDKMLVLDLEYGYSDNSGAARGNGNGYRINLIGEMGKARYAFEKNYSDPNFFGYYHDSDYTYGTFFFPIYRQLTGYISGRNYRNNLDLDPLVGSATDEESYRGGLYLPLPTRTNLSLTYEDYHKKDLMTTLSQFNFRERFFTAGIGQSIQWASVQGYIVRGSIDNRLTGNEDATLENYSIYSSFAPTSGQSYSLYARAGQEPYSDNPQRTKSVGITGIWHYHRADLNLNYQINNMDSGTNRRSDTLMSLLAYVLPNAHTVSFRSRWISHQSAPTDETSYLLTYSIPLSIPVNTKKGIGGMQGTVSDASGKPIPNVAVDVGGLTAVTDSTGSFSFPAFKPGSYYLTVEQGSIGMGKITSEKMPLTVEVKGGEISRVSLGITPSCRVTGRLTLRQENNTQKGTKPEQAREYSLKGQEGAGDKDKSALKLANILVEIARESESIRQMTDEEGRFYFHDLRPGKWTLKVADDNLPPYHYLEKPSYPVELKSGEEQDLVIPVLPRVRKIQMIDEGKIK